MNKRGTNAEVWGLGALDANPHPLNPTYVAEASPQPVGWAPPTI
ncbi:hypothetical protein [Desulfosarcina variabilis]